MITRALVITAALSAAIGFLARDLVDQFYFRPTTVDECVLQEMQGKPVKLIGIVTRVCRQRLHPPLDFSDQALPVKPPSPPASKGNIFDQFD